MPSKRESEYFAVGKIDQDQVVDYARRVAVSLSAAEENLAPNLGYLVNDENNRRVA